MNPTFSPKSNILIEIPIGFAPAADFVFAAGPALGEEGGAEEEAEEAEEEAEEEEEEAEGKRKKQNLHQGVRKKADHLIAVGQDIRIL